MESSVLRERLQTLAESHPRLAIRHRARVVLLTLDGLPTAQIAAQVGLSTGQVRRLRNHWRTRGMAIFPQEEAGERRPPKGSPPSEEAAPPEKASAPTPLQADDPSGGPVSSKESTSWVSRFRLGLEKPPPIVFDSETPMSVAGQRILQRHFALMLRNEAGTREGKDIEALHDMRVATRRMRAALRVFAPFYRRRAQRKLAKALRTAGRALGKVRDWDVFLENARHYQAEMSPQTDFDVLLAEWQAQRDMAQVQLRAWLSGKAYASLVAHLEPFIQEPPVHNLPPKIPQHVRTVVPSLVYARLGNMLAYEPFLSKVDVTQLHVLRSATKRLRYTLEFFSGVLGEESAAVIKVIKRLQDHLGALNDADVACRRLTHMLSTWDETQHTRSLPERYSPYALAEYLAFSHQKRHEWLTTFPQTWESLLTPDWKRRLALAIAAL